MVYEKYCHNCPKTKQEECWKDSKTPVIINVAKPTKCKFYNKAERDKFDRERGLI